MLLLTRAVFCRMLDVESVRTTEARLSYRVAREPVAINRHLSPQVTFVVGRTDGKEESRVQTHPSKATVYYDDSCPLCRAETAQLRVIDRDGALCVVDVPEKGTDLPHGLAPHQAIGRFHVRAANGQRLSGAAAFVNLRSRLPGWRWRARAAAPPGAVTALERGYRLFLPVPPYISRRFGSLHRGLGRADPGRGQ